MKIGDPFHEDTHVGATISRTQFDIVMKFIQTAKEQVTSLPHFVLCMSFLYHRVLNSYVGENK
jgi:hypothetical protein